MFCFFLFLGGGFFLQGGEEIFEMFLFKISDNILEIISDKHCWIVVYLGLNELGLYLMKSLTICFSQAYFALNVPTSLNKIILNFMNHIEHILRTLLQKRTYKFGSKIPEQLLKNCFRVNAGVIVMLCYKWNLIQILFRSKTIYLAIFVPSLGWLSDPFKWLSDLQLGDEKVTLNHLVYAYVFQLDKINRLYSTSTSPI